MRDELKILVHSQRYNTLPVAINGASAEENLIRPSVTREHGFSNKNEVDNKHTRSNRNTITQCYKCGKTGHYGRDCRGNKTILPKSKKKRINTLTKFCKYCKKFGHSRDEC